MAISSDVQRDLDYLRAKGVPIADAAPPFYRLSWRLGWHFAPPLLAPFALTASIHGLVFSGLLSAFAYAMTIFGWREESIKIFAVLGALLGLANAVAAKWQAHKLGLSARHSVSADGT